jgi:hypothetical protein
MWTPSYRCVFYVCLYAPLGISLAYGVQVETWKVSNAVTAITDGLIILADVDNVLDGPDIVATARQQRCVCSGACRIAWCANLLALGSMAVAFRGSVGGDSRGAVYGTIAIGTGLVANTMHVYLHTFSKSREMTDNDTDTMALHDDTSV